MSDSGEMFVYLILASFIIAKLFSVMGKRSASNNVFIISLGAKENGYLNWKKEGKEVLDDDFNRDEMKGFINPASFKLIMSSIDNIKNINHTFTVKNFIKGVESVCEMVMFSIENNTLGDISEIISEELHQKIDSYLINYKERVSLISIKELKIHDILIENNKKIKVSIDFLIEKMVYNSGEDKPIFRTVIDNHLWDFVFNSAGKNLSKTKKLPVQNPWILDKIRKK